MGKQRGGLLLFQRGGGDRGPAVTGGIAGRCKGERKLRVWCCGVEVGVVFVFAVLLLLQSCCVLQMRCEVDVGGRREAAPAPN